MKSLKCPYCGDTINVVSGKSVQKCSSCGNEFVLDKEEVSEYDVLIENANEFLRLNEFKKALDCYETANKIKPKGFEGWLGIAKSETENFNKLNNENFKKVDRCIDSVKNLITKDDKKSIEKDLESYEELKLFYNKNKESINAGLKYNKFLLILTLVSFLICLIINIIFAVKSQASYVSKIGDCILLSAIIFVVTRVMYHIFNLIKLKTKTNMIILIVMNILICALLIFVDVSFAIKI